VSELLELANWFGWRAPYIGESVESLPGPSFTTKSHEHVSFSTNNYLAISASPRMKAAAIRGIETYGVGNCESRLLTGNLSIYSELECKLARSKGKRSAILFATGYLANVGVLSALPRVAQFARVFGYSASKAHSYAYFGDEHNHISIREGIRASGVARFTYRHLDLDHLEVLLRNSDASTKIIVTDGVFSQDGDIAPLPDLSELAERHEAMLYVDDAHGTGVLGTHGGGIAEHFGVASEQLIYMGTLSKAYGAIGGFIAASSLITEIIRVACPAYGFTSTLPPDQALAVSTAIDIVRDEPERRQRLWENQRYFVARVSRLGYRLVSTSTQIVPILIGDDAKAERLAAALAAEHIHVDVIKFPAVPFNTARLRIQLNANHTRDQINRLVHLLECNAHLVFHRRNGGPNVIKINGIATGRDQHPKEERAEMMDAPEKDSPIL
jgi:glycine C-acetyltransferase